MSIETSKWVRIMCDYAADGVWDDDGIECCPEDLPLPADLAARIHDWQAWYDRDCTDYLPVNGLDVISFSRVGLAIAQAMKIALPEWTVVYYDEANAKPTDACPPLPRIDSILNMRSCSIGRKWIPPETR